MESIHGSDSHAGMTKVTSWADRLLRSTALPRTRVGFCGLMTTQIPHLGLVTYEHKMRSGIPKNYEGSAADALRGEKGEARLAS